MGAEAVLGLRTARVVPYHTVEIGPSILIPRRRTRRGGVNYPGIDELCEQMAAVCGAAVDPLEIAAALEFEGMGDRAVRQHYGLPDVFSLAEEMYRRVPRQPTEPPAAQDVLEYGVARSMLRGLLYGLPAVCFPAAAGLLSGRSAVVVLVVSMLLAWSLTQGLAYLGHLRMGWLRFGAARRVLRAGLAVGTAVVALALLVISLLVRPAPGVLAFGAGQAMYMLGGCVLMVLGIEHLLLGVLAPAVVGATVFLMLGRPPAGEPVLWLALAATPLLAVAVALYCTRPAAGADDTGRLVAGFEVPPMLARLAFGVLAPALAILPVMMGVPRPDGAYLALALAAVPLSLSMGAAEWGLSWYRRATQRLLRATDSLAEFGRRSRRALIRATGVYLGCAAALTAVAVVVGVTAGTAVPDRTTALVLFAFLAFGGGMFLSLLLHAYGRCGATLVAGGGALAVQFLLPAWEAAQLVANAGFFAALAIYATVVLGRAVVHVH